MNKLFLTLTLMLAFASPAFAKHHKAKKETGEKVEWKNVPAAVQATIQGNSSGGKVTEVRKESKKGTMVYRAEVKGLDGKFVQVAVNEAGKLMKVKADENKNKKKHHFSFGI